MLSFSDFTGSLAGEVDGFDRVEFSGNTTAVWSQAETVVGNDNWLFDLSGRSDVLAGEALLNWSTADFTGDTLAVNLGAAQTSASGWSIAAVGADTSFGTFDFQLDGSSVASGLALDAAISGTSTAYDGWGFTLENEVLKFKQLA